MTKEQQYWEDTQEALSRIFDRCEEIDPQSGYDMLDGYTVCERLY